MINNWNENEIVRRVKVKLLNHSDIILLLPSWFYFTAKIYPCVYAYLRIRVFVYTRIYVYAYLRLCVFAYMSICVYAETHWYFYLYMLNTKKWKDENFRNRVKQSG